MLSRGLMKEVRISQRMLYDWDWRSEGVLPQVRGVCGGWVSPQMSIKSDLSAHQSGTPESRECGSMWVLETTIAEIRPLTRKVAKHLPHVPRTKTHRDNARGVRIK